MLSMEEECVCVCVCEWRNGGSIDAKNHSLKQNHPSPLTMFHKNTRAAMLMSLHDNGSFFKLEMDLVEHMRIQSGLPYTIKRV